MLRKSCIEMLCSLFLEIKYLFLHEANFNLQCKICQNYFIFNENWKTPDQNLIGCRKVLSLKPIQWLEIPYLISYSDWFGKLNLQLLNRFATIILKENCKWNFCIIIAAYYCISIVFQKMKLQSLEFRA